MMITKEIYEKIKTKYGDVASWAIWEEAGLKPKSNMGHLNIFDLQKNPLLLSVLKNNVIMVGLNFSRPLQRTEPFKNFHDLNPSANDFKIRYAFKNSEFYGAYMTDIIKDLEMRDSPDVKLYLKNNPHLIDENIAIFREELSALNAKSPIILAFGTDTYKLLNKHLTKNEYSKLIKLTHYSHQISKENYKTKVYSQISEVISLSSNIVDILTDAHSLMQKQVIRIGNEYMILSDTQYKDSKDQLCSSPLNEQERIALNNLKDVAKELIDVIQKREKQLSE